LTHLALDKKAPLTRGFFVGLFRQTSCEGSAKIGFRPDVNRVNAKEELSMRLERHVAIVLLAGISACSGADVSKADTGGTQNAASKTQAKPMDENQFIEAASRAALIDGHQVAAAKADGQIAAVVLYRQGDAETTPPVCVFRVVEANSRGISVVGSSDALIGCPLDSSAEEVRAGITLAVGPAVVTIEKEAANGNETFLLERGEDGIWYVTKASYARPEEDASTGDMVVFVEEATYPPSRNGMPLGEYSYAAVEKDLVKRAIE